eukprot:11583829-Alexandrium_andersonii.AAC.1
MAAPYWMATPGHPARVRIDGEAALHDQLPQRWELSACRMFDKNMARLQVFPTPRDCRRNIYEEIDD